MMHADDVRASIKVCMFDQYGTVVDMQTGLTEAAAPFLAAKGWQGDPNSFVTVASAVSYYYGVKNIHTQPKILLR
jgi:hypothetical protein